LPQQPLVLKLKIPHDLPFARLLEHRALRAAYGEPSDSIHSCRLVWRGCPLDWAMTPVAVGMPAGIEAVQSLRVVTCRGIQQHANGLMGAAARSVEFDGGAAHDVETELLRLQLREAKAKSELLEFQLSRQLQQPLTPSAAAARRKQQVVRDAGRLLDAAADGRRDAMDRLRLPGAVKEMAAQPSAEHGDAAAFWRSQFERAARELAGAKLLIAQHRACLDRLGIRLDQPLPIAMTGSAFVRKDFDFASSVGASFQEMPY
jgi:hypothetical protein